MIINTTPSFFGKKTMTAYRDDKSILAKTESYQDTMSEAVENEFVKIARKLEELLPAGQHATMQVWRLTTSNKIQESLDYDLDIWETRTGEPTATILVETGDKMYQLEERGYPNNGAEFSTNEYPGTDQMQINIFGQWKTFTGALKDYVKNGTSTTKGRKPKEIYV